MHTRMYMYTYSEIQYFTAVRLTLCAGCQHLPEEYDKVWTHREAEDVLPCVIPTLLLPPIDCVGGYTCTHVE